MMETDPNHNKNLVFINTTDKETKTCELAKKFLSIFDAAVTNLSSHPVASLTLKESELQTDSI